MELGRRGGRLVLVGVGSKGLYWSYWMTLNSGFFLLFYCGSDCCNVALLVELLAKEVQELQSRG